MPPVNGLSRQGWLSMSVEPLPKDSPPLLSPEQWQTLDDFRDFLHKIYAAGWQRKRAHEQTSRTGSASAL